VERKNILPLRVSTNSSSPLGEFCVTCWCIVGERRDFLGDNGGEGEPVGGEKSAILVVVS